MRDKFYDWLLNVAQRNNGGHFAETTVLNYTTNVFSTIPSHFNVNILALNHNQIESLISRCESGDASEWNNSKHGSPSNALKQFLKFRQTETLNITTQNNEDSNISKIKTIIDETRFILLSGFVLCEADLRNFARIKELSGVTNGLCYQTYDSAQEAIEMLKLAFPDIYQAFRDELFKKLLKVNSINCFDTRQVEALFNSENQCAHYCVAMARVFHCQHVHEIKAELNQFIRNSHLEG